MPEERRVINIYLCTTNFSEQQEQLGKQENDF